MVATVMLSRSRKRRKALGSRISSRSGTTSAAPLNSAMKISEREASNAGEANCTTLSVGPRPNVSICAEIMLRNAPFPTTTPFGVPVDPDVWIT
jgi:hypothetical protein